MISRTAKYALRAVVHLAAEAREAPVPVDAVAEQLDVPRNYLSKTLHLLAKRDILTSSRGPGGGFELARPAGEISLADVVEVFDDLEARQGCLLGEASCSDATACAVHHRWKRLSTQVTAFFRETTVGALATPESGSTRFRGGSHD